MDETAVREVSSAVSESNMMTCSSNGSLGPAKRREAYVRRELPLVNPIEYVVEKGKKQLACVPIVPCSRRCLTKLTC